MDLATAIPHQRVRRLTNFIVLLIGLVLVGYSLYMISQLKGINVLSGTTLGLGVVDSSLALILVTCGWQRVFYLRLYAFIIGLLELAQVAVAVLFLMPKTQQNIIDTINPDADLKKALEANLGVAGWVLLAIVAFQALTLVLVLMQSCAVDAGFSESSYDSEALLGGTKSKKADRFGALDDEMANAASSKYKEKASKYYEKYGLNK